MEVRNLTKIVRNMNLYKNSISKSKYYLNETEYELIRYVSKRESRSLKEISDYLNCDKALVTRMSKKLEKEGYLIIKNDENDSRKKNVSVTQISKNLKEEVVDEETRFYNECLKVLNEEEIKTLDILITKVYKESKRLRKSNFKDLKNEEK